MLVALGLCVAFVSLMLGYPAVKDRVRAFIARRAPGRTEAHNRRLETWTQHVGGIGLCVAFVSSVSTCHDESRLQHKLDALRAKVTARHLTPQEASKIAVGIRAHGRLPHFTFQTMLGDAEAHSYLNQLATVFEQSGVDIGGSGVDTGINPDAVGVFVAVPPGGQAPPGAMDVLRILDDAGLHPQPAMRPELAPGTFQVIVGRKSAPEIDAT